MEKKEKKRAFLFHWSFYSLLSLFCLLSCGLEAFYYIDYIPEGDYSSTTAVIRLPSSSAEGYNAYFSNFVIFYRIYISGNIVPTGPQLTATDSADRRSINSTLNSDYSSIYSLTDITSTSVNTSNLETNFQNRDYYPLSLEGANIDTVLGSASLGRTLTISFPPNPNTRPTLSLDGGTTTYNLRRAQSGPGYDFKPKPESPEELFRSFLNHRELSDNNNATPEINRDTAGNSAGSGYTYVSIYIAAMGLSLEMPPRPIYSQPTFLGIFQLAESS